MGQAAGDGVAHLGDDRRAGGGVVDRADRRLGNPAGHQPLVAAAVVGEVVRDRADEREAIGDLRMEREEFGDFDARDVGLHRLELAAVFGGSLRLHVVGFHVGKPTRQPDEDDGGVVRGRDRARLGPQPQQVGEPQAGRSDGADLEEAASRHRARAVFGRLFGSTRPI